MEARETMNGCTGQSGKFEPEFRFPAPDAGFEDPVATAAIAFNCLAGPVTALLKGFTPPGFEMRLEEELVRLLTAYFNTQL